VCVQTANSSPGLQGNDGLMKFSRYNYLYQAEERGLIYNTASDAIILLAPETVDLLRSCMDTGNDLEKTHPSLHECLLRRGFIVDDDVDEYGRLVEKLKADSESRSVYQLTVNPTMDCNYRCWYCYESHDAGSRMDDEVFQSVCRLIDRILMDDEVVKLNLSFFGGEPLLCFKETALPLMEFSRNCAEKRGKKLDILFTTNGYLLDQDTLASMEGFPVSNIQIPFDGGRTEHDSTKRNLFGTSSFDVTVSNVVHALQAGLPITVRCNYTSKTIDGFSSLADVFSPFAGYPNLDVSFHRIWQQQSSDDLHNRFLTIFELFKSKGFCVTDSETSKGLCYADYRKSAVVNYNGDVYKCTARKFDREARLGVLDEDGTISWNARAITFSSCKYRSAECASCLLFPICLQGCSQNVIDHGCDNGCLMGYSSDERLSRLHSRIKLLLADR